MSHKHVCQLRGEEKSALIRDLTDLVKKLNQPELQPLKTLTPDNPPEFMKRRLPRYLPNFDLVPLITHVPILEIRPTSNPQALRSEGEDPAVAFVKIDSPGNPYRTSWDNDDDFCKASCRSPGKQMAERTVSSSTPTMNCGPGGQGCYCTQKQNIQ